MTHFPDDYIDYISSSEVWEQKRAACIKAANYKCGYCGACGPGVTLHAHHTPIAKMYELGSEPVWTLKSLCNFHHKQYHELGKLLKR